MDSLGNLVFDLQLFNDGEQVEQAEQVENTEQTEQPQGTILGGEQTEQSEPISYDFKELVGEAYDETKANEFTELLKGSNLPADKANEIVAYGLKYAQEAQEHIEQQRIEEVAKWGEETKTALGKDFEGTVQKCGVAIERLQGEIPNIREVLNETGVGNRIEFVKAFALLGELLGEDTGKGLNNPSAKQTSIYDKTDFSKY